MSEISTANIYDSIGRVTPWKDWTEWYEVYINLFSEDSDKIQLALNKVQSWRLKFPLSHSVDAAAYLTEALMMDRLETLSDQAKTHLLSSCVARFVSGLIDIGQKGSTAHSMYFIANNFNFPKFLVDLRHSIAHSSMPPLSTLRYAIAQSINWIKENYWIPQTQVLYDREQELTRLIDTILNHEDTRRITKESSLLASKINAPECRSSIPETILNNLSTTNFVTARFKLVAFISGSNEKLPILTQFLAVKALSLRNAFGLKVFNALLAEFSDSVEEVLYVLPLALSHILVTDASDEIIKLIKSIYSNLDGFDPKICGFIADILSAIEEPSQGSLKHLSTLIIDRDEYTPAAPLEDCFKLPHLGVSRNLFKKEFLSPTKSFVQMVNEITPEDLKLNGDTTGSSWWSIRHFDSLDEPEIEILGAESRKVCIDLNTIKVY